MFFDSHCHLTSETLRDEFEAVCQRALDAGVSHLLNIGDTLPTSRAALAQCEHSSPWMRAAVGVHPQNALQWKDDSAAQLRALAASSLAAAIGEIGLDWIYDDSHPEYPGATRAKQTEVFTAQLEIARELCLPVVVHNREADEAVLETIATVPGTCGVIHCWAGSIEAAARALELGLHLGFTGLVTFKNAEAVRDAVRLCPLDKLLIETDAPYLAPIPHRGKRNEPSFLPHTARTVAEIKGVSLEELARITRENALRLLNVERSITH